MTAAIRPARPTATPLRDLIDESRDEAAFLWRRWETELASTTRNLDEVWLWSEDRLQGALDGVRAADDTHLLEVLAACLRSEQLEQRTLAAHLLANASASGARELLIEALRQAEGPALQAMVRGIETAALDGSFVPVTQMLSRHSPAHRAALCRIKAFQRAVPGQELVDTYQSNEVPLQVEAMRASVALPLEYCTKWVEIGLAHESLPVRMAAMEVGIRRSMRTAWLAAVQCVHDTPLAAPGLLKYLAMLGGPNEQTLLASCLQHEALRPTVIQALGLMGTLEAVDLCLTYLTDAQLARWVGESYCLVVGVELERDKLHLADPPESNEPIAFEADDLDANLIPAAHESWPLPDPAAVMAHWQALRNSMPAGQRFLRGQPCTTGTLLQAVTTGPMLHRPDHVFELAVRTQGQLDVEIRAFRTVQQRMLAASRGCVTA